MDDQENNYDDVIETLFTTFSGVIEKDAIATVVESYEGDLNLSANALTNIAGDLHPVYFNQSQRQQRNNVIQPINKVNTSPYVHVPQHTIPIVKNTQGTMVHSSQRNIPIKNSPLPNKTQGANASHQNTTDETNQSEAQATQETQGAISYANASQQKAPPKNNPKPKCPLNEVASDTYWTDQIQEVIVKHNKGWRVLILMRGVPGSGKSHLAREILQKTVGDVQNNQTHIMSTDDYFYTRGVFKYDKSRVDDAHLWNQHRAQKAMKQGVSPIMIDNTNIDIWEMGPYVRSAINNGYIVIVIEAHTHWAKKANHLFKKNIHRVPFATIQRMLDNYQEGITGDVLLNYCGTKYPENLTPPVLRKFPPLPEEIVNTVSNKNTPLKENVDIQNEKDDKNISSCLGAQSKSTDVNETENGCSNSNHQMREQCEEDDNISNEKTDEEQKNKRNANVAEKENCLDEFRQVENASDNEKKGKEIDCEASASDTTQPFVSTSLKPQNNKETTQPEQSTISFENTDDWRKLSAFPAVTQATTTLPKNDMPKVNKISSSTSFEMSDTYISTHNNPLKLISAVPRDINIFYVPKAEKIPIERMYDKSTSTSNGLISMSLERCKNAEQHFKAFRKMFNNFPSYALRDIFEKCRGDVNWAVEIIIDNGIYKRFGILADNDSSEDEDIIDNSIQCVCFAAYGIVPDDGIEADESAIPTLEATIDKNNASTSSPKKLRKDASISNTSMQLKRQIEKNVVISDNHYSEHCLKIRNLRRGDQDECKEEKIDSTTTCSAEEPTSTQEIDDLPSTITSMSEDTEQEVQSEIDEDDFIGIDLEKTININIGKQLVAHLDTLFGREDMKYPEHVVPKINMPVSMLNEINALWMESLMHQLEDDTKQTQGMIEQDAEFARELALKEEEFLLAGKKSEVPDFQEIMDLDYALSLYQKDIEEWRNNEPLDMAAKLTRDKLHNTFPEFSPEVLSEILMSHNNVFNDTVEAILISLGKSDILKEKHGITRFVMSRELKAKQKYLEEKRLALSEEEWPILPRNENIRMEDVEEYRAEATKHMELRRKSYQKAKEYMKRGMLPVASFFSSAGAFHTRLFEQASSKAAVSLAQVNAERCKNNLTLDLHNYRVCESLESLDIFLDVHIQKLRQSYGNNRTKVNKLFFITGRGLHSCGAPKIKPACKRRLRERGLTFYELNPGLLGANVCANHKLSDEIA